MTIHTFFGALANTGNGEYFALSYAKPISPDG
jgi:hypothetical protein